MFSSGGFPRSALTVAGLLAVLLFLAVAAVPSPAQSHLLSTLAQTAILVWAVICALFCARRSSPYFRQLWRLLGAALGLAAVGVLLVAYYGGILRAPRATPWPSDIFLFGWVAPAAMMLLPWRSDESAEARWESILDFTQIGIVFVTAYLYFFYVPSLWEAQGMVMFSRLLETALARDALLAAGFLIRAATLPRSPARAFFARIAVFFLSLGIAEGLISLDLSTAPQLAAWISAFWVLPFIFIVFVAATWSAPEDAQPAPHASDQSGWVASQILPVTIPLLVIFMGRQIAREQITIAALAITASFGCSAARLLLSSHRQRRIADDLRRAENAARQSEQMFSAAFRSSPDAISIAKYPETSILETNDSFTRLTGFTREESLGKTTETLGLWVDPEFMRAMRSRFREQGELRDEALRFRRKDGEIRHGRLSASLISLGEQSYSLVVVRDITESKRAEDALRASEERFRSLVETLRVGISAWGLDARCQFANSALLEMLGLPADRLVGKTSAEMLHALREDGTRIPGELRPSYRVVTTGQPVRNEIIGWRVPGAEEILWTLADAVPEFDAGGKLVGAIASLTNITDLKRAEAEKRASQEMFSKAFRASPDSMVITTLDEGRYLEVNEAYTRQFGWSREEAIGKTVGDLRIWPNLADREIFRNKLLNSGRFSNFETSLRAKSGQLCTVLVSADIIQLGGRTCVLSLSHDITAKKQQEEALRASEQRSRTLLEALRVGVITWGPDGRCRSVNRALLELTGLTEEQHLGKTGAEIVPACDEEGREIPSVLRPAARAISTRAAVRNQVLGLRIPGQPKPIWVWADAVPEFSPGGELKGVIASYTDITALKRAEEQKRVSEEMFSTAFHSSPDSMTISGLSDGRLIEVNEGFTRLFGWSREEVLGRTSIEIGLWKDPRDRQKLIQILSTQGRTSQYEIPLCVKSGEERSFQLSMDLITLNGQVCMLTAAHDITERKKREEALHASEERFRTLVQNIDAGIVLFSSEGRIQFANAAAQRIFGVSEEEARGKLTKDVPLVMLDSKGNEIPFASRPVARVLATGRPVRNAVLGWRRVGSSSVSWLVGNAVPQISKDGAVTGVIASLVDITEQKRAEEKLRRLSARLLQLQDEERRRLGRDLHDSLAQLVLAVNLRLAQITRSSTKLDQASRQLLAEARATLQEMSRQIRTLSYLLHPPLLDELGLSSAIKEYAQGFSDRSGIHVDVDLQADFRRLSQEAETALFRIVQESLTNIQKHSGSRTASIRLQDDASRVTLEIQDRGRGMTPVAERKPEEPGARFGVGILGMRERLAQLGGELQIESNGKGTIVRARIPVPVEEPNAMSNPGGG